MASYDMDTDTAGEEPKKNNTITFRFCRECSNMLYPKEDEVNSELMFACRMCTYSEKAEESLIYRNALKEEIAETAGNVDDVKEDPTVGDDDDDLPDYAYDSAAEMEDVYGEETIPEMCTLCGKEILCPYCGRPSANGVALEAPDPGATDDPKKEAERIAAERRERALSGAGFKTS